VLIPPAAHTYQSDVETVHRLEEDEFFDLEEFSSRETSLPRSTLISSTSISCAPTPTRKIRALGKSLSGSLPARRANFAYSRPSCSITTSTTQGDTMNLDFPSPRAVALRKSLLKLAMSPNPPLTAPSNVSLAPQHSLGTPHSSLLPPIEFA
jgi:hypothetical protein